MSSIVGWRNKMINTLTAYRSTSPWRGLAALILFLSTAFVHAQSEGLRIGDWRSYLPYKKGLSIAQTPEAIFYGSEWALMRIDKQDLSLSYVSKVEGLSDIEVKALAYDETLEVLVVAYQNSNLDLIFKDEVVNLDQIKNNTQIVQDRTIFDIHTNGTYAYFATGFGLVQLDLANQEFGFTTFTGQALASVSEFDGYLYISTDDGIYRALSGGQQNLADFGQWEWIGPGFGLPGNYSGADLATVGGKLYAGVNDEIYEFSGDQFKVRHRIPNHSLAYTLPVTEGLFTGWICDDGCNDRKYLITDTDFPREVKYSCSNKSLDAVVDEDGRIWFADESNGYHYAEALRGMCNTITPDRPSTHNVSELAIQDNALYVATGGVTINYGYIFRSEGLLTNESGTWTALNRFNNPQLADRNMRDFLAVEAAPDGTIYVGTFWDGLIALKEDGEVEVYDQNNSSLLNSVVNPDRNRITDVEFDGDGNLWILNHDAPRPLSVLTAGGEWANFSVPTTNNLETLTIDDSGVLWIAVGRLGILIYDPGEDVLNGSDDQTKLINSTNSALTTNAVNSIVTDRDGAVWVGTQQGPVLFDCGSQVFAENCRGLVLIVESNGIAGPLLGTEDIRTIEVDGANRKWFGTSNGVFVQSSSGETQVREPITVDNSPLFDNTIIDIEIDPETGEVYIATNKGIVSVREEAVEGTKFHQAEVDVFPNPVRPGYAGPIAIQGLAENANVKVTDIQGRLVYEGRSLGGQAIWNGNDLEGRRAASGVYLVFSTAVENLINPDAAIGKIIFVN